MVVRISRVVYANQSPLRHRPQEVGLARRLKPRALRIVILRLSRIDGELLLQVSTVRPDVAQPQSDLRGQLVLDGQVPSLLMLVVPSARIPIRRSIPKGVKSLRRVDIHRGGGEVVGGCGSHNKGVIAVIRSRRAAGNVGIIKRIVGEPQIEWRSVARGLQQQGQRHPYIVYAVGAAYHGVPFNLIGNPQTGTKVMSNRPKEVGGVSNGIRGRPSQPHIRPGGEHGAWDSRDLVHAYVTQRNHLECAWGLG